MVVLGKDDPIIPLEYADLSASILGMARIKLEDGHLHPQTSEDEVAWLLREYCGTPVDELHSGWRPDGEFN